MRNLILGVLYLMSFAATAQTDTTIKVLGIYPSHMSLNASQMTSHLQQIPSNWNAAGLPAAAVTTIGLLNGAVAVPISYPGIPATVNATADQARYATEVRNIRQAWQADVVVLFTSAGPNCGASAVGWLDGNFVPTSGLDLRFRQDAYLSVVNPLCQPVDTAHEFGHLGGGGHATTGGRLYSDSRAFMQFVQIPQTGQSWWKGTPLLDPSDAYPINQRISGYSRNQSGAGDATHNNTRTLTMTARSLANYFIPPTSDPVLYPPINLHGFNLGCVPNGFTRHDLYWSDNPASTITATHYEVWKSQPVGQPFIYGWTEYAPYSPSEVSGATARARVNACSGANCTTLSTTYYDAAPTCSG